MQQPFSHTAKYARMKIMDDQVAEEFVDCVAKKLWWNAGSNDPKFIQELKDKKWAFAGTKEPVPVPTWEAVQSKDMWRRMAVAVIDMLDPKGLSPSTIERLVRRYHVRMGPPV